MKRFISAVAGATLLALLHGCATSWQAGDGETLYTDSKQGFSYIQQSDWYRSPYKYRGFLTLTKDGPDLQYIAIGRRKHQKAFAALEKDSTPNALPQELAQDYVADTKAQLGLDVIEVKETGPAMVGGVPGFRIDMEYRTEAGLRYRNIVNGAATEAGLYIVEFRAPLIHYYDRDFPGFEKMLSSFAIISPPAK